MRELLPSLNKKRITWQIIKKTWNKIVALLFLVLLRLDGYFIPPGRSKSGKPEIYVSSRLSADLQIATAVHEIKDAVFDNPLESILFSYRSKWATAARRHLGKHRRHEYEPCTMGALTLITELRLRHASRGLFDEDDEFITDAWTIRLVPQMEHGI